MCLFPPWNKLRPRSLSDALKVTWPSEWQFKARACPRDSEGPRTPACFHLTSWVSSGQRPVSLSFSLLICKMGSRGPRLLVAHLGSPPIPHGGCSERPTQTCRRGVTFLPRLRCKWCRGSCPGCPSLRPHALSQAHTVWSAALWRGPHGAERGLLSIATGVDWEASPPATLKPAGEEAAQPAA